MQFREIKEVYASKVFNSKGKPAISVRITTSKGTVETIAPQGTSKGKNEVKDFSIKGIDYSIEFVNNFAKKLCEMPSSIDMFDDLEQVEKLLKHYDSSEDYKLIGGNALYAFEASLLKAAAKFQNVPLWKFILGNRKKIMPRPLGNAIGGGMHVSQNLKTDYQEFLLLRKTENFYNAYFINLEAYKELKKLLIVKDKKWQGTLTDENAMASSLDNKQVFELLQELRDIIKEKFGTTVEIGVDMAASSLWNGIGYVYSNYPGRDVKAKEEQLNYVQDLIKRFNLVYVEDPFYEEDFNSFSRLKTRIDNMANNCLLCGDDLTCTNPERIERAVKENAINAVIIKPNQIGSLMRMKKALEIAKQNRIIPVMSHRSGESADDTIADLCVGFQIPLIKAGILGKERFAKLNRLMKIEREKI